jgi:hypothetical protein
MPNYIAYQCLFFDLKMDAESNPTSHYLYKNWRKKIEKLKN